MHSFLWLSNIPLQCSCLENPRDGRAWWAAVYGVTQSWTWLKWLSSSKRYVCICSAVFQSGYTKLHPSIHPLLPTSIPARTCLLTNASCVPFLPFHFYISVPLVMLSRITYQIDFLHSNLVSRTTCCQTKANSTFLFIHIVYSAGVEVIFSWRVGLKIFFKTYSCPFYPLFKKINTHFLHPFA